MCVGWIGGGALKKGIGGKMSVVRIQAKGHVCLLPVPTLDLVDPL